MSYCYNATIGLSFVSVLLSVARLEEKEMLDGVPPEKSSITIEALRASQTASSLSLAQASSSVSAPGSRAGGTASSFSASMRHTRTQGDASTQASEKEIDTFTEATLNQSWILPNVSAQARGGGGSSRRSRREKDRDKKALSASDFEPVKIKTIVPRKYQDAGTTGSPSQPVPVTFVPHQGSAGSQLTTDFSSFDFSLNETLPYSPSAKPASVKESRPAPKPKASKPASPVLRVESERRTTAPRPQSPGASASASVASAASSEGRSRVPSPSEEPIYDDFRPININTNKRTSDRSKANNNNSTSKSADSAPKASSPEPKKRSNGAADKKAKQGALFSPVAANGARGPSTPGNSNRPASPGMVFFPTLLGSPSAPILTFKPVGMLDDDFGF